MTVPFIILGAGLFGAAAIFAAAVAYAKYEEKRGQQAR